MLRSKAGIALVTLLWAWAAPAGAVGPWTLESALGLPERLSISADVRLRTEFLGDQFRRSFAGNGEILALRSRLRVGYRFTDWLRADVEIQDSRVFFENDSTTVSTGHVNTGALLQAFLQLNGAGPLAGETEARLGRLTMDVGSRRLIARNRFRNTANSFTGLDGIWRGEGVRELRAFYTLPVQRLPYERADLVHGKWEFDDESFDTQFWGLYYRDELPWQLQGELYWFGLHQRASNRPLVRTRDYQTPGFRIWREARPGSFDFEIENVFQFGDVQASASSQRDLDHFAHFHHLTLGYRFDAPWSPHLSLLYDYASGDKDPNDDKNGRFNTLFGARRFEYGPTSIYGAFARTNINTPGIRLRLQPRKGWTAFAAFRAFWLAQDRDAWVTAGIRDTSGDSGRTVGSQLEFRIRWDVWPKNVRIETGYAHLFAGRFIDDAPNSNRDGDSDYAYFQTQVSF